MSEHKKKKITEYKVVVFDLDGTLYYQKQLRKTMAKRLIDYYLHHPVEIWDLFILKKFREVRDVWDDVLISKSDTISKCVKKDERLNDIELEELQARYIAKIMHSKPEKVSAIVKKWIYVNPLNAISESKDRLASMLIEQLTAIGICVVILSDYPVEDKLNALGVSVDGHYYAAMERLNELKPSPKGLYLIMHDYELDYTDILVIGDRDSKDGEASRRAGVDYVILGPNRDEREAVYEELLKETFEEAMNRAKYAFD